jgi:hypothetical protein
MSKTSAPAKAARKPISKAKDSAAGTPRSHKKKPVAGAKTAASNAAGGNPAGKKTGGAMGLPPRSGGSTKAAIG